MSSNPSQRAPDRQDPPMHDPRNERIRQMIKDLDTPLDGVPKTSGNKELDRKFRSARKEHDKRVKQEHRNALKRARSAARKAFRIRPSISSRRAATALLTAGAVGVAAFTGPGTAPEPIKKRPAAVYVMDQMASDEDERKPAALLKASAEFKQALIEEEGVRYVVYRDVAGYPTVGVGHLVEPEDNLRVGDRISEQQVLDFLDADLKEAEEGVRILVDDLPLYQHEFDALVDLVYNVGLGTVSERKSPKLNAAIESGDYEAIAAQLDYRHAAGQVAKGLEYRSERRAKIFMDAAYEDPREAPSAESSA